MKESYYAFNGLPADASRPGLLKYIESGKCGQIFALKTPLKMQCVTENKKIIYISQYIPL